MWFLSPRKTLRAPLIPAKRAAFRPRFEALEDRCLLSAGALDPTFGNAGLVTGPFGSQQQWGGQVSVVVQTDGKIVAGSKLVDGKGNMNFALARYNTNGTLDATFGNGGIAQTAVGSSFSYINGLAIDSNGNIVAVGYATVLTHVQQGNQNLTDRVFAVARYTATGTLDTSFGGNHNGIVLTNIMTASSKIPGYEEALAVAIQGDGKIDVAGYADPGTLSTSADFSLVRYNANGTLDATFGANKNGIVVTPNFGNGGDTADALAIQTDANGNVSKIVLSGYNLNLIASPQTGGMAVARYTPAGLLDTSFNAGGVNPGTVWGLASAGTNSPPNSLPTGLGVVVQSNGAVVVAGYAYYGASSTEELTLVRLTSSGQLDKAFGTANTGFVINSNMVKGAAITQAGNGDLLVSGSATGAGVFDFGVAAYLPGGTPDTSFGTGGVATADFAGGDDLGRGIAIQSDGKIVVAGQTKPPSGTATIALARFLPPDSKITSVTANPASFPSGALVTLTVSGILNSDPSSTITSVVFYLDAVGGTPLTVTLLSNNNGTWSYSFDTTGLSVGAHTLFAEAVDSNGVFSDPLGITVTVAM